MNRLFAAVLALAAAAAHAQDYPNKPVRLISGFQPGGGSDIVARLVAERLTEAWGKPFIVDNRSGAGGTIALAIAAKAPPDGYTLLVISGSQITNAAFITKVPFDIAKAYAPITQATSGPYLIAAHPAVPVSVLKSSMPRCANDPVPDEAYVSWPGFALASAIRSFTFCAGIEGCAAMR